MSGSVMRASFSTVGVQLRAGATVGVGVGLAPASALCQDQDGALVTGLSSAIGGGCGMAGPLASVRVVVLAGMGPVPFTGMLLADMGRSARPGGRVGLGYLGQNLREAAGLRSNLPRGHRRQSNRMCG